MNKKLPVVLSALVLLSALSVSYAYATPVEKEKRGVIVTDAVETNYVDHDQLVLTVSIETQAKKAKDAMDENTEKASAVVNALKAKVNANEVSTSNISVYPVYNYKNKVNSLEYYRAQNEITVKTSKINIGGDLISTALENGANRVTGITFELKDKSRYCNASMQKSLETAKAKAELIANTLGIQIAGVKRVTSNCSTNSYSAYNGVRMLKASASSMDAAGEASTVEVPVEIKKIPMTSTTSVEFFVK